jgi:hypothetical protein
MQGKEWSTMVDPEEMDEYITWLCSVANDAQRIIDDDFMVPQRLIGVSRGAEGEEDAMKAEEVLLQIELSRVAFEKVQLMAADQVSCLLCMGMFHSNEMLLDGSNLLAAAKVFYEEQQNTMEEGHQQHASTTKFMHR